MFKSKGLKALAKDTKEGKNKRREDEGESPWAAVRFAEDAERFKALGDPTRLAVIGFLLTQATGEVLPANAQEEDDDHSSDGATVSEIASALMGKNGKELSTLSHHLKELRHAGLVVMTRHGKNLHYRAETRSIAALCERIHCPTLENGEFSTK